VTEREIATIDWSVRVQTPGRPEFVNHVSLAPNRSVVVQRGNETRGAPEAR